MIYDEIALLLKNTIGLDAASIGATNVARAVQARVAACDLADAEHYGDYLKYSPDEFQALIEAVVVPETWFFRDPEAFAAMINIARKEWAGQSGRTLKLLSLPCATGEEPYSMAMALIDAGFSPKQFQIDAVDISADALKKAELGLYGKNSFRSHNLDFRDRHFTPSSHGYYINDDVRQSVRFLQDNVLATGFLRGTENYDAIFCRNMLIYFDHETQKRVASLVHGWLSKTGALFVGPAEAGLMLDQGFWPVKMRLAFAFRKSEGKAIEKATEKKRKIAQARLIQAKTPSLPAPIFHVAREAALLQPLEFEGMAPAPVKQNFDFDEIEHMANEGKLKEAAGICEQYLRDGGADADAFYLLGLIRDSEGNSAEAADNYRKAIYLNPNHQKALALLVACLKEKGYNRGMKVLNARLDRLSRRERQAT